MNGKVGIWIDHRKAVTVFVSAEEVTVKTLESEVGPHARYSSRAGYPSRRPTEREGGEEIRAALRPAS